MRPNVLISHQLMCLRANFRPAAASIAATNSLPVTEWPGNPNVSQAPNDVRLFDPFAAFPRIDFTLSTTAEESLRAAPDDYVEASLTLTDQQGVVGPLQVKLRRKGVIGSRREFDEKMAFKVDINAVKLP